MTAPSLPVFEVRHTVRHTQEGGFALIIALILLLAMTIIGVTTIRSTLIEQRLANATLDRNIAFQSAEAALRMGESRALAHAQTNPLSNRMESDDVCDTSTQANCTTGLCLLHDPDCPLRATDPTVTAWASVTGLNLGDLAGQAPQYLVEYLGSNFLCSEPDPTAPNDPNNYCKRYRISARAQPADNERAFVLIEVLFVSE